MILCFFHQPALRRHLNDGGPLTPRAKAHLERCPRCREMVAAHLAIIKNLSAKREHAEGTPAFLHARVMNRIQATPTTADRGIPRWAGAVAAFAIVVATLLFTPKQPTQREATLSLPTQIAFKPTLPANPLETEIESLRADTLNAAKAVAANFWPDTPPDK